jgi:DNA polymerase III sliding clamp (beta) subunit (PCNA family)
MRFTCSRDQLLEGVLTVQKAISNRTTLPILEGILFDCRAGDIKDYRHRPRVRNRMSG